MNENLNAPEPSQDHLHDTSERPPRDPAREPNDAAADEVPQQHSDTTADTVSGSPDEPVKDEEL